MTKQWRLRTAVNFERQQHASCLLNCSTIETQTKDTKDSPLHHQGLVLQKSRQIHLKGHGWHALCTENSALGVHTVGRVSEDAWSICCQHIDLDLHSTILHD